MIRSRVAKCAALVTQLVVVAACGGGDGVGPPTFNGTYELKTVDSKALPALTFVEGDYTFEVVSGVYALRDDQTFSTSTTYREKYLGWTHVSTHSFEGTFTVSADTLFFSWTGGNSGWTGIWKDRELTISDHGHISVFRK